MLWSGLFFVEPLVGQGIFCTASACIGSITWTSAVRWLAVVALTLDIMRMQLRGTQTESGVLKAIGGNDMQGGIRG